MTVFNPFRIPAEWLKEPPLRFLWSLATSGEPQDDRVPYPAGLDLRYTGTGKSHEAHDEIADLIADDRDVAVAIFVPTHRLGAEAERILISAVRARHGLASDEEAEQVADIGRWYGIEAVDENTGDPICKFAAEAKAISEAGGDPFSLCETREEGEMVSKCQYADNCPRYAGFVGRHKRWILPHASMPHPLRGPGKPRAFRFVLIDEDPTDTFTPHLESNPDVLRKALGIGKSAPSGDLTGDEAAAARQLHAHGEPGEPTGTQLVEAARRITSAMHACFEHGNERLIWISLPLPHVVSELRTRLLRQIDKQRPASGPNPTPADKRRISKASESVAPIIKAAQFLKILHDCMCLPPGPNGEVPGIRLYTLGTDHDANRKVEACDRVLPAKAYQAPTQILSTTAQPALIEPFFRRLDVIEPGEWQKPEFANYHRVAGAFAIGKLVDHKAKKLTDSGKLTRKAIEALARRYRGGTPDGGPDVLVVCQKELRKALEAAGLPDNVEVANFGAVEGIDKWKTVRCIYIIGRPLPPLHSLITRAERVAGDFIHLGEDETHPPHRSLTESSADGSTTWRLTHDYYHPNQTLYALIRKVTHGAVHQADRGRGKHRAADNPLDVYIQSDVELPFKFNARVTVVTLTSWFYEMAALGFVPLPHTGGGALHHLMAHVLPGRYATGALAKWARKNRKDRYDETLESLHEDFGGFPSGGIKMQVQTPAARGWVPLLVDAATPREAEELLRRQLPEGTVIKTTRASRKTNEAE